MNHLKNLIIPILMIVILSACSINSNHSDMQTTRPMIQSTDTPINVPTDVITNSPQSTGLSKREDVNGKYFMMQVNEKNILTCFDKVHEFTVEDGNEHIILFSGNVLKELKVTEVEYTSNNDFRETEERYHLAELPAHQAFYLTATIPEGIPYIKISFYDAKGEYIENLIRYDGKHGGIGMNDMSTEFANGANLIVEDDILMKSHYLSVKYDDTTLNLIENNGKLVSAPVFSPDRSKAAYISPYEWEEIGKVFVFDSNTKQIIKLNFDLPDNRSPFHLSWLDNDNIMITDIFADGTVARGEDTFLYNLSAGKQKIIFAGTSAYVTISSTKVLGEKLLITVAEYIDDNFENCIYYDYFINSKDVANLAEGEMIFVDRFRDQSNAVDESTTEPTGAFNKWREIYAEYLDKGGFFGFYIGDINHDGLPEAVTWQDETNSGSVYYFTDNGLQILALQVDSTWGKVGYLEETNQIIFLRWYGHTQATFGSVEYFLYDWTPGGYIETYSLIRESGYEAHDDGTGVWVDNSYGQGYINGEEVDFNEFESALTEMDDLLKKSTWFPVTDADEVEDYADYLYKWKSNNNN